MANPHIRYLSNIFKAGLFLACLAGVEDWGQARADSPKCGVRNEVVKALSERFKELPVSVGLSSSGILIEVLRTEDGSSWTLLLTPPRGATCILDVGEGWQDLKPVWPGPQS